MTELKLDGSPNWSAADLLGEGPAASSLSFSLPHQKKENDRY